MTDPLYDSRNPNHGRIGGLHDPEARSSAGSDGEFFESRDFAESNFREMEVQICGATRTVQFSTSDHGGDHPTSPSVAIDWDMARDLATWVLARTGDVAQPTPIYQVMATDDDEGVGKDVWMDVTKEVFDDLKQRNDVRYRILAASQPSPAATVEIERLRAESLERQEQICATNDRLMAAQDQAYSSADMETVTEGCTDEHCEFFEMLWKWFADDRRHGKAEMRSNNINGGLSAADFEEMLNEHEANIMHAQPQTFPMWQPIETAPKQSRILYVNRHGEVGHCSWYEAKNDGEEACWWDDERDDEVVPLGWMPQLPVWSASTVSRPTEAMK